jgi:tetratricopeptide (TPR) repeat protein
LSGDPLAQAHALLAVNRPRDAINILLHAISSDPGDEQARQLLGFALTSDKKYREAVKELQHAIALNPEDAVGHDYMAWALHHLGRHKEALRSATEAARLTPGSPRALRTLTHMQLGAHQVDQADATVQQLLRIDPRADTFDSVGQVRIKQKKTKEAVEWFQKAVALEPQNPMFINNLGAGLLKAKKVDRGIGMLGQALRTDPRNVTARTNLFMVSQLYLGWTGLLLVFGLRVAADALLFHRFSLTGVAIAFCFTTAVIIILRYYRLWRMDGDARKFILAEVKRGRRATLPLVSAVMAVLWVAIAVGYVLGALDRAGAGTLAAAAFAMALLVGVVLPWPVEYLPWRRRNA